MSVVRRKADRRLRRAEAAAKSDPGAIWNLQRERARSGLCPWCGLPDELGHSTMRDAGTGLAVCWKCYLDRACREAAAAAAEAAAKVADAASAYRVSFNTLLLLSIKESVTGKYWPALSHGGWRSGVLPVVLSHRGSSGMIAAGFGFRRVGALAAAASNEDLPELWPSLAPTYHMHEGCYVVTSRGRPSVTKTLRQRLREWADADPRTAPVATGRIDDIRLRAPKAAWARWLHGKSLLGREGR